MSEGNKVFPVSDPPISQTENKPADQSGSRQQVQMQVLLSTLVSLKEHSEETVLLLEEQACQLAKQKAHAAAAVVLLTKSIDELDGHMPDLTPSGALSSPPPAITLVENSELKSKKSCWDYIKWRVAESAFLGLIAGNGLTVEDSDEVMNALILVNALILTIPFGVFPEMEFWGELREVLESENCKGHEDVTYNAIYRYFTRTYFCVIYSSLGCIVLTLLYYLLRPRKDADFSVWWKGRNGREFLLFTILGSIVSIFAIFYLAAFMFQFYSVDPAELCDVKNDDDIVASYATVFFLAMYIVCRHL